MKRIGRIYTDLICGNPLNLRHRVPIGVALGVLGCGKGSWFPYAFFNRGVRELTRRFAEFFLVRGSFFATCGGGRVALRGESLSRGMGICW